MRNNGKNSEAEVQSALKTLATKLNGPFDWQRLYDTTSARNVLRAQVGDFLFFLPDKHGVIEVKSTQHAYRLARTAFSPEPWRQLTRRSKAGGHIYVFIHHYVAGYWRFVPFETLFDAFNNQELKSIDLRNTETYLTATSTLNAAFQHLLKVAS